MRVWVTRTEPGATATAQRVRALGHEAMVAPVLEVRTLGDPPLDLTGAGAMAFTSSNAVRAFAARVPVEEGGFADLPVFAVGEATAAAARRAGFRDIRSAEGDVRALGRMILAARDEVEGCLLHPCGTEQAGDLVGGLAERGIDARSAPIYETVAVHALPDAVAEAVHDGEVTVLLHSPKAARVLANLLRETTALDRIAALGLSPACLAPVQALGFGRAEAAAQPNEAALLKLLMRSDSSG